MKLLFKQRFFSWFDSYDIYDEAGNVLYNVKGELSWGHLMRIYDDSGREVGYIKEKVFAWMPKFEIYIGGAYVGSIRKQFSSVKFNVFLQFSYITCRKWIFWISINYSFFMNGKTCRFEPIYLIDYSSILVICTIN